MAELSAADIADLEALCPDGVKQNVDLGTLSRWRIGGRADLTLQPASVHELAALMRWFRARGVTPVTIGLTTNLLFDDSGLRVPCVHIGHRMSQVSVEGSNVNAQAGVWVPGLARTLMQNGLGGLEHICGIPGTLGGLICMNGGSQRKGIGTQVTTVESVTRDGQILRTKGEDCGFAYRQSLFRSNGEIITGCTLHLTPRESSEIRSEMLQILSSRRKKFPKELPNCGSVFKSNPAMYADIGPPGEAIERLGFKGMHEGGAQISPMHANFIVNNGGARAGDVVRLITRIRDAVEETTGYRMEAEACYVAPDGTITPADSIPPDALH